MPGAVNPVTPVVGTGTSRHAIPSYDEVVKAQNLKGDGRGFGQGAPSQGAHPQTMRSQAMPGQGAPNQGGPAVPPMDPADNPYSRSNFQGGNPYSKRNRKKGGVQGSCRQAGRGGSGAGYGAPASGYGAPGNNSRKNSRNNGSNNKGGRNPWRIVLIVSIIVLVGALAALGAIAYQYFSQQQAYDSLEQYAQVSDPEQGNVALSDLTVDWDALRAINPDIVGWIYIPNSPINYPVVQGVDNQEYLHQSFDGSTGWLASAGTIFLDSTNAPDFTDRNSALYGHHMNDGSMFAALSDWQNNDAFNQHRDIYLLTPQGNYRLKSFALVKTTGTDAVVQTTFSSDDSYRSYIQDKLDRSVVTQQGDVLGVGDIKQSMMFATCEYSQSDGRAVLFASVVETTAANDPWMTAQSQGTTGLSADQVPETDGQYKEAA